jgi:hypothetical protein
MRKIIALIITGAALLALAFIVAVASADRYPTAAEIEAERLTIERMQAVAPAQTLSSAILALLPAAAGVVALVLASAWGSLALIRFRRRELVRVDAAGRLPVLLDQLPYSGPATLEAYHVAQLAAAQRPGPLAHTYSPTSATRRTVRRASIIEQTAEEFLQSLLSSSCLA